MSDDNLKPDEPAECLYGRSVSYKLENGDQVTIVGYLLENGGAGWEFNREGNILPLRLSQQGMNAMLQILQDLTWSRAAGEKTQRQQYEESREKKKLEPPP